jgi:hypothetical protein
MLTRPIACLFLVALAACSKDPKSLTDSGYANLGKGDNKAALEDFDAALPKIDASASPEAYLRAAIGRCQALAHVDPKRATTDFIALANAHKGQVRESDFSLLANELLRVDTNAARMLAVDLLAAAKPMFPDSGKLVAISVEVEKSATRAKDPDAIRALNGIGYGGGSKH